MSLKLPCFYARTKILATLGPATCSADIIKKMIASGMDGVRLNFSHGTYNSFEQLYNEINKACSEEKVPLAVLADMQGPKIRIGNLAVPEIDLETGGTIQITTKNVLGNRERVSTSYNLFDKDAEIGDPILIDDGLIRLRVTRKLEDSVECFIENGGILKSRKGMNVPGMKISSPSVTEKDFRDIEFAVSKRTDYIALSFVRSPNDITDLRNWLKRKNISKPLIAKIEKKEAVDSFDEIMKAADGIMIARGDLGVELQPQEVPVIQKEIIKSCNAAGKIVITATQMLESMINNPAPTRAEASDIANAVWDGSDVVMLSGETSIGKYPTKAVQLMNDIIVNAEEYLGPLKQTEFVISDLIEENLFDSVGRAIADISRQVKAAAIVVFTLKGRTARNLSKYRPHAKIIALSDNHDTISQLNLVWGITPLFFNDIDKEHMASGEVKKLIETEGLVNKGDIIILTAGAPWSEKGRANWLRFEHV